MTAAPGTLTPLGAAALLGTLQGVTEFLPISSSGHLAAAQLLWPALAYPGITLEVATHCGTTAAVLLYHRRQLRDLGGSLRRHRTPVEGLSPGLWLRCLLIGTLPGAAVGLGLEASLRRAFERLEAVAAALALTGVVLMASRWRRSRTSLTPGRALAVGAAQGIAAFPGASRSGLTISLALMLGVPPRQAVTFSLLLSVPAVAGAAVLELGRLWEQPEPAFLFAPIAFATLWAGGVGYACIGLVHRAAAGGWWYRFAWYCWTVAALLALAAR